MEQFFELLSKCPLFSGVGEADFAAMLNCLGARTLEIEKGCAVFQEGDPAEHVGVVLSGAVQIVRVDYHGNRSVLGVAEPGQLFGEVFACAGLESLPVSAVAQTSSRIMLLNFKRILTVCSSACSFHTRLIRNLLQVVAQKSLSLNRKIGFMSCRTTRDKLMSYLLDQAKQQDSNEFIIPHDRQALADFLGVERSAMSAELSKLKKSGVIDFKGSWFRILDQAEV